MQELFHTVLNMSAESCWIILAVLLLRALLRRAPKGYSYALWSVVLFRLLCPVSFQSAVNLFALTGAKQAPVPQGFGSAPVLGGAALTGAGAAAGGTAAGQAAGGSAAAQVLPAVTLAQLLAAVWLAGAVAVALYGVWSLHRLAARLRWRLPDADGVYRVHGLETAFVLGVLRPRIYLPTGLDAGQERYILAHEKAHLRRGDPLWRLLAFGALCLHWFNPLAWAAYWLSGRDMEMSCDEAVVRRFGPEIKKGYSASLLSLATGRHIILGAPLAFGEGDTAARIRNVLNYKKPAFWAAVLAALAVAGLCVFLAADPQTEPAQPPADPATYYTFRDGDGGSHTAVFTLPDGWSFDPVPQRDAAPAVEGGESEIGSLTIDGVHAGTAQVGVFRAYADADEDTRAWLRDPDNANRRNAAYNSFMLGSLADWESGYTVLAAGQTTEAAVTTVFVNMGEAGAMAAGDWEVQARAALYFDLEEGAYVKFVLSPELAEQQADALAELARSIRFAAQQADCTALRPLYAADRYETGSAFAPPPADLESRLQNAAASGLVPDARAGGRAPALAEAWGHTPAGPGVVLLGAYPEQNLWLYGYYDDAVGFDGLLLDAGETQTLYAFAWSYTGRGDAPALYLTADGKTLYAACPVGTGTGVYIEQLYAFSTGGGTVQGYAVDSGAVADAFADQIRLDYRPSDGWVTAFAGDTPLLGGGLEVLGLSKADERTPAQFFCGQQLYYAVSGAALYAVCEPVLCNSQGRGEMYLTGEDPYRLLLPVCVRFNADGRAAWGTGAVSAAPQSAVAAWRSGGAGSYRLPAARQWQADLTHDGTPETITFDVNALETLGLAHFAVYGSDGTLLLEQALSTSHAGWNTLALYRDDTGDYLLEYQPYCSTGSGYYSYALYRLAADGTRQVVEQAEVSFSAGIPYDAPDNDVDALMAFAVRATELWSRSALLVSTDVELLASGLTRTDVTEGGRRDAEAVLNSSPAYSVVVQPGANYYAADDALADPLHYVEQMTWTQALLEEGGYPAASGLRARLEDANRVLAAHRAEVENAKSGE